MGLRDRLGKTKPKEVNNVELTAEVLNQLDGDSIYFKVKDLDETTRLKLVNQLTSEKRTDYYKALQKFAAIQISEADANKKGYFK